MKNEEIKFTIELTKLIISNEVKTTFEAYRVAEKFDNISREFANKIYTRIKLYY